MKFSGIKLITESGTAIYRNGERIMPSLIYTFCST